MLRQSRNHRAPDAGVDDPYRRFRSEQKYDLGWPSDWEASTDPYASEAFPASTQRTWRKAPSTAEQQLQLIASELAGEYETVEERVGMRDPIDMQQWQRPMETAGYISHREQFV